MSLSEELQDRAAGKIDLLVEQGEQLRMPHSRALGRGLFELRFRLGEEAQRITYWFAPGGRIVLLTMFRKQRDSERTEVERAHRAKRDCSAHHGSQ